MTTKSHAKSHTTPKVSLLRGMYVAYYINGNVYYWNADCDGKKTSGSGPASDFIQMLTTYSESCKLRLERV